MIHREDHNELFVIISNDVMRNKDLSLSARGLLGFMLTFADDWMFSFDNIVEQTGATRYEVRRNLSELQKSGYVRIKQTKSKGKFSVSSYDVFETPCVEIPHTELPHTEKPHTELPHTEFPCAENRTHKNTNIKEDQDIRRPIEKKKREKKFCPPTFEEVQAYCQSRNSDVDPQKFFEYYDAGAWKDAKGNPVKNWKQKFITWEGRSKKPKTVPINEDPWDKFMREEGMI